MNEIISINPATLEEVASFSITSSQKVKECVANAKASAASWQRMGFKKRAQYLLCAREYMLAHLDEFAKVITIDNGKPLAESFSSELYPVSDLIYYFSHNAEKILSDFRISVGILGLLRRSSHIYYKPIGVVGVISPWNYPFSIPVGEVVMALLCGNTVLLKPSSTTSLVGQKIKEMFEKAGLPEGVFQVLLGDNNTGNALVESSIDKILFTGSEEVGKKIMAKCANRLTPVVLELGGKDPMIVCHDADLEVAASGAVWGAFANSGQCCASVERVYVHESIFEDFLDLVIDKTKKLRQGNGLDENIDIGPMTTEEQLKIVETQVQNALQKGAKVHCGGKRNKNLLGYFYEPTVISNLDHSFECIHDETFGPLMPVMKFSEERQAIHLANDTRFGLTASVWTKNIKKGQEIAQEIRAGTVMVNDCVFTHAIPQTPWGGRKSSGFGRSHSEFGLKELVEVHHIHTNKLIKKDFWWYPYSSGMIKNFFCLTKYLTEGLLAKIVALPAFLKIFKIKKL